MCGRYTIVVTIEQLMLRYFIEKSANLSHTLRYNVAPMQYIPAVIHDGKRNRLGELRWGLVPSWASDERLGSKMINARAETLLEKKSFQNLIRRKRAIVPADGFYEWKPHGASKQPMRITMKDGSLFSLAALYDTWIAPDGRKISTCTIITTTPNSLIADIHDRMPAILRPEDEAAWLDRNNEDVEQLMSLLHSFPSEAMRAYPVSPIVGNVRNDSAECIVEQTTL